ncbi:PVC-type heme-binding CxxCH protein [Brevifollis gellanilyticus]|nr:PVC-type heme-binding CxxCH protein [Brevifollis gellanilyticus]
MIFLRAQFCLAAIATTVAIAADPLSFPTTPPTEAKEAAKSFHVLDGFEMQLIAAEPLVTDPVAITYDENGRAYVCEMNDYPYTDKSKHKPSQENPTDLNIGKVRLLTDTDGDGVFDKASVFAEGLSWPTGAACWKGGIFVTATPDVWYLKDTNDDGVADVKQKVFTGFKKLNVQAVMNNPIWGLDHRIYVAGGSNGGEIQRAPGSESVMPLPTDFKPLPIKRHDFSFDPSSGDVRLESGGARFGNTFDDWGNRFLCNIRNPCQHVVLPYRYLERNPYLVIPSALNDCAEAGDQLPVYRTSPPEPWRDFRAKRWVQEGSHLPKSELVGAGVVTSSAGITVYRGDAYPKAYRDFAFVADVAGNLFYRMKLVPDGVTFKAVQVDGTKNFCTSDDVWFRPVNFVNAPDGCLHVCDMYREVIEHPWSIPDDIHAGIDLLKGKDKGRIWRLAPKVIPSASSDKVVPSFSSNTGGDGLKPRTTLLGRLSTAELVSLLDHPNAWHRETAQRLLFERQDKSAVELLRELAKSGKTDQGKVCALHALSSLSALDVPTLDLAARLLNGPVAEAAAELFEPIVPELKWSGDLKQDASKLSFAQLAAHAENRVAIKALFSMRDLTTTAENGAGAAFWSEAMRHVGSRVNADSWLQTMVLCIAADRADKLLVPWLLSDRDLEPIQNNALVPRLAGLVAAKGEKSKLAIIMTALSKAEFPSSLRSLVLQAMLPHTTRLSISLATVSSNEVTNARLREIGTQAINVVNTSKSTEGKVLALPVATSLAPAEQVIELIRGLLMPSESPELQLAAIEALGTYREPVIADLLLEAWPKLTPALRDKATTLLLSRTDRIAKLLDAIEEKKIQPNQLSAAAKATLGRQKSPALAKRITKLIGDGSASNRKEVIDKYLTALGLKSSRGLQPVTAPENTPDGLKPITTLGDAARGAKIYETACMVCHKHKDRGNDVGPHLGTIQGWTAEQILTNVLDPNREVSPNFALYIIETNDGRFLSGLISSETAGNLTLKRADGGTDSVLRSEIKSLTSPGISLMPEGLEAAITPQQMADLIEFLRKS